MPNRDGTGPKGMGRGHRNGACRFNRNNIYTEPVSGSGASLLKIAGAAGLFLAEAFVSRLSQKAEEKRQLQKNSDAIDVKLIE